MCVYASVAGKWYTQVVDPANPVNELSTAAFVDQLLGQWCVTSYDSHDSSCVCA